MLFPVIVPLLGKADVPREKMPWTGKLAPELVIVLLEIVLPVLPVTAAVEKNTVPPVVLVPAPLMVQRVTVLFNASLMNRMVEANAVALVLSIVSELPPLFNPSTVTLVAPLRSIKGLSSAPETVRGAPPEGWIETEV